MQIKPFMFIALALGFSASARGENLFEGFYRIERDQKHVGFVVQRYRQDGLQRILTTYLRLRQPDETEVFESFKSVSGADGRPVSSEHRGTNSGLPAIFARFAGTRGRVDFGSPQSRYPATVEQYDFLGSFTYLVGNLPSLGLDKIYRYHAFAEERGKVATGTLHVAGISDVRGVKTYALLDDYLGEPVESFVAANGQPLGSRALAGDLTCYWVASREDAIDVFKYPNRDVIAVFGDLPTGKKNVWASLDGFDAESVIRGMPKWSGKRVLTPTALAKALPLPVRSL